MFHRKSKVLFISGFSLALLGSVWAAPKPGRPVERPREESKPVATEARAAARAVEEARILQVLAVPREEVLSLLKEFKADPEQHQALKGLLKDAVESNDSGRVALLRGYLRLMRAAPGEFHLQPTVLEARAGAWSPTAKAKFAGVLERAHALVLEGKAATREDAFRQALKEKGLDQKYEQRCRK